MTKFFAAALLATSLTFGAAAKAEPVLSYWGGYIPQAYELTAWGTWVPACDEDNLALNPCENENVVILPAPKPSSHPPKAF